ncbi:MAG: YegS/Rv2252/BmrU family lipid kinase [Oscillospiraceae bacterium]|nr:YegS/Rv2252/BmrU family lipid kinase [Oscillospiraceae bacterium]
METLKKLLLIFNPTAGKGAIRGHLTGVVDALTKGGWLVTAYPTQSKGDARRATVTLGEEYERIVCCGGDGTLSETIAGLLELERPPALGYLPAGTTNDFARNLHLPKGLEEAARTVASHPARPCDVGMFNGTSFVYVAAFGAFTSVSYDTPQEAKNIFGHLAYVLGGISQLGAIKSYELTIRHDGGSLEGEFIYGMASNTVSVGGFKGLPIGQVCLDDGLLEVLLVRRPRTLPELNSIIQALLHQQLPANGMVVSLHTARLRLESTVPLPWTLDGEYGGDHEVAEIENLPQAIRLIQGEAPEGSQAALRSGGD